MSRRFFAEAVQPLPQLTASGSSLVDFALEFFDIAVYCPEICVDLRELELNLGPSGRHFGGGFPAGDPDRSNTRSRRDHDLHDLIGAH